MSSDEKFNKFKNGLSSALERILVSEFPHDRQRGGREYNREQYYLREYRTSKYRDSKLFFWPNVTSGSISQRDQDVYACKYTLLLQTSNGDDIIGHLERRPKRKFTFARKPYQSSESFLWGVITQTINEISPITKITYEKG